MAANNNRKQLEKDFLSGKIPFALDESTYRRFPQRNNALFRVGWDKSFEAYMKAFTGGEGEAERVGKKGYSRIGYAALHAAWTMYLKFPDAFSWKRISSSEKKSGVAPVILLSSLPKYESTDPQTNSQIVKRVAQIFGACDIGICEVEPKQHFIYSHDGQNNEISLPEGVKYAIVIVLEKDYDGIGTSPYLPAYIAVANAYSRAAVAISCMGEFLRNLGYQAVQSGNETALSVPMAVQAGLGQFGRNGLLIHPKLGQRVRLCKVFTDFPLAVDQPINFGVTEFCKICKKCAKACPAQCISYDDNPTWESPWDIISNNSGVYKWYADVEKCYYFWVKNTADCSNCIRACPFTKPPGFIHDMTRFFIKHFRFTDRFWLRLDNVMAKFPWWAYGEKKDPEKFWKSNKYLGKKRGQ